MAAAAMAASQQIGTQIWISKSTSLTRLQGGRVVVAGASVKWRKPWLRNVASGRRVARQTHQRHGLRWSALSSVSGSPSFSSSKQVLRYLSPRPLVKEGNSVRALLIRAGLLDIIKQLLSTIWNTLVKAPVLAVAKFFQREVDEATDVVKGGAQVVLKIAHGVDNLSDVIESYAEKVAEIAEKVIETTDKVDEQLEDVVDVLKNADDIDDFTSGISKETGISASALTDLKEKSETVQAKSAELKAASTELKEVSKTVIEEKEKS